MRLNTQNCLFIGRKELIYQLFVGALLACLVSSCQTDQVTFDTAVDEFILPPEFSIQVIAAEPLLQAPVAIDFDEQGRIWAVELTGYMRDIDGADEEKADGKIVLLEDHNQDGVMDSRKVILQDLQTPRTLLHAYGGLLYSNGSSLWWAELEGTEVVQQVLVDSLYVVGGNIEHQPNGLLYHLDNWIYSANSMARYRFQDGKWLREATSFRGQWGLSADEDGRLFYNNNSLPLAVDGVMPNQLIQNEYQKIKYSHHQAIATSNRLFAYQATAANRGYIEGVLDEEGKIKTFTSACSPFVYSGRLLGPDFYQNTFVCAPEANLIKRYILQDQEGERIAAPAYDSTEFLISKDETFRPVNLYNGPDGALYIVDMRKGVIQHRAYMTSYLREKILDKGLDTVVNKGRIYRITTAKTEMIKAKDLNQVHDLEMMISLASPSYSERLFAQKQLVFNKAIAAKSAIEQVALNTKNPYGQLHALWTLEGLGILEEAFWEQLIQLDNAPVVLETLVRFSSFFPESEPSQTIYFNKLLALNNQQVNTQLALRLGNMHSAEAKHLLVKLAKNNGNNTIVSEALVSSLAGQEEAFYEQVSQWPNTDSLQTFLQEVMNNKAEDAIQSPQLPKKLYKDNRTAGFDLYNVYCAACHGLDGKGKDNLSPPLTNSEYVSESKDRLIVLVLNGMQGPLTVNGKRYEMNAAMPGVKNNPNLSDKDIADLLTFLRNSFSFSDAYISEEEVASWREKTKDRTDLFTEEELENY